MGDQIRKVTADKKQFLALLLLADEQESMIDRYLERGDLFVLEEEGDARAVCVVTKESPGTYELKNLAVVPAFQRQGYGTRMIDYVRGHYKSDMARLLVGTGETPGSLGFYHAAGFRESGRIANFFTDHYDHPMIEEGVLLKDMIYLSWEGEASDA